MWLAQRGKSDLPFHGTARDRARYKLRAIFGLSLANFAKLRAFLALSFIIIDGLGHFGVILRQNQRRLLCTKKGLFSYERRLEKRFVRNHACFRTKNQGPIPKSEQKTNPPKG